MTEISLANALGGLLAIPQFFVYRLVWNSLKNKFEKTPCYVNGTALGKDEGGNRATWVNYPTAIAGLQALRARDGQNAWTLGWWVTKEAGYWFLDADNAIKDTGELTQEAAYLFQALPGAFCEQSSGGKGFHWIGRGLVPPHSSRPAVAQAVGLEFYTDGRGIAFGLNDKATGNADVDHTAAISIIAGHWFKPNDLANHAVSGVDPSYRGPYDDQELLRRALNSQNVKGVLNGQATFADLWNRNLSVLQRTYQTTEPGKEFGESEADQALAFHLAFWTGRDAARIERLMLMSALKRDKWDKAVHANYLANTIAKACAGCSKVYVQEERVAQMPVATTEEARAVSDEWQQRIMRADELTLRNEVVPGIAADRSIEMLDRERLAGILKERLADFMIPASIGQCRKMLRQVVVQEVIEGEHLIPEFAKQHVYVERSDSFFNLAEATESSRTTFQAKYNRAMPEKQNGDKEDAARWCLERWNMPTVYDAMYLPGREPVFVHNGMQYANLYTPASVPPITEYTPAGIAAIHAFAKHLEAFCGGRQEVYSFMLAWMAFNVQNPGVKVRFAPILKGVQGDGKSLLTSVLGAAMGERNVASVGPSVVMNSGGFTDWAHGACVIGMEELKMEGKNRYVIANAFKDNITNSRVTINRKGKGLLPIVNISNFIAYTNFPDAVPLEDNDRRWYVVFSPYTSVHDAVKALGLANVDALGSMFDQIFDAVRDCPGQFRKWLSEMVIPPWFNPNAHAPDTAEKHRMRSSGEDEEHAIARQVIATGAFGVCREVVSSACLSNAMRAVCIMEGGEIPQSRKMNKMLTDLGYQAHGFVKWQNKSHRVWTISTMCIDEIRNHLDRTVTG